MSARLPILALLPLTLLAACGGEKTAAPQEGDSRSASGEVLEGTISDSMLPLGETTSQPPLVAPARRAAPAADEQVEAEAPEEAEAASEAEAPEAATEAEAE